MSRFFAAEQKANAFAATKVSQDTTVDGDYGRIETRTTTVIHDVEWIQQRHDWPGLKAVVMVESSREISGKTEREKRFYLNRGSPRARRAQSLGERARE